MRTQNPLAFKEPGKAAEVWDKRKHRVFSGLDASQTGGEPWLLNLHSF